MRVSILGAGLSLAAAMAISEQVVVPPDAFYFSGIPNTKNDKAAKRQRAAKKRRKSKGKRK